MFFFGAGVFLSFTGIGSFLIQAAVMVAMCLILYGWLLSGKYGNMQLMLLIGVIIGTGLRSVSSFMRRLLAPSEFDILQARLFGSVSNADAEYFPVAILTVMHDINFAAKFSDRVCAMKNGQIAAFGSVEEIMNARLLTNIFGTNIEIINGPYGPIAIY